MMSFYKELQIIFWATIAGALSGAATGAFGAFFFGIEACNAMIAVFSQNDCDVDYNGGMEMWCYHSINCPDNVDRDKVLNEAVSAGRKATNSEVLIGSVVGALAGGAIGFLSGSLFCIGRRYYQQNKVMNEKTALLERPKIAALP